MLCEPYPPRESSPLGTSQFPAQTSAQGGEDNLPKDFCTFPKQAIFTCSDLTQPMCKTVLRDDPPLVCLLKQRLYGWERYQQTHRNRPFGHTAGGEDDIISHGNAQGPFASPRSIATASRILEVETGAAASHVHLAANITYCRTPTPISALQSQLFPAR